MNENKLNDKKLDIIPVNNIDNPEVSPLGEEDYEVIDGIKHCPVCHEPIEQFIERSVIGRRKFPKNCKCRREERAREEEQERLEKHRRLVEENTRRCFSQYSMKDWSFENDTEHNESMDFFKDYVSNWDYYNERNIGLLISGDLGVGKTFTAACIANALLEKELRVKMTNFGTIIDELFKESDKTEYIRDLCRCDLLIIDDLSTERDTSFALECIFKIVDERYRQGKPLIITTNLPVEEMKNAKRIEYQRIYDRILYMCTPVGMKGENLRLKKRKEKINCVQEMQSGAVT